MDRTGKIRLRIVIQAGKRKFACSFSCMNPSLKSSFVCLTWTKSRSREFRKKAFRSADVLRGKLGYKKGKAER